MRGREGVSEGEGGRGKVTGGDLHEVCWLTWCGCVEHQELSQSA